MNIKKKNQGGEDDQAVMTQAELNQLKKMQNKALKKKLKKLDALDDLEDIAEESNPLKKKKKKEVNIMDAATLDDVEAEPPKEKKPVSFSSLKNLKNKFEDPIYLE